MTDAFIAPDGSNRETIEPQLNAAVAQILDMLTTAVDRSPMPDVPALRFAHLPDEGVPFENLLERIQTVMQYSTNMAHPGYIGHMDTMPTLASIVGDMAATALNNNMFTVEMSPVLTRLEDDLMRVIAALFMPGNPAAGGVMAAGGSLANLQALAVARNVRLGTLRYGLHGLKHPPVIFTSEAAHNSVKKAAMLLGMGLDGVLPVSTNDDGQMDGDDLQTRIREAQQTGRTPFAIVATAGTTVTGSIDPLSMIAQIARQHNLWLHVDAAYGGALQFSPQYRNRLAGIEEADSITFNPQKWLYVARTSAMVLFRDMSVLEENFRLPIPYTAETDDDTPRNRGEISVHGTRHADVLKLWLSFLHLGMDGYARIIDRSMMLTDYFVKRLNMLPYLELAAPPQMNIVCFRGTFDDDWQKRRQADILETAPAFLSRPFYQGKRWLRAVLLNPYIKQKTLDDVVNVIREGE